MHRNVPRGRFLRFGLGYRVPDAKTVGLHRDALAQADVVEELFCCLKIARQVMLRSPLRGELARQGVARNRQILDAVVVPVPRNHNTREDSATTKNRKEPRIGRKPANRCRKDLNAHWTKKYGKSWCSATTLAPLGTLLRNALPSSWCHCA